MLFYGPPGLGKTTLAGIVANELGGGFRQTSGPMIRRSEELAHLLTSVEDGDVFFIDEIHRLPMAVEEVLYSAMEDRAVDLILGKGMNAQALRLEIPQITIVGATTRMGSLSDPLRDRFANTYRLEYYDAETLGQIVQASAARLKINLSPGGAALIAKRCRRTPRIANRLLRQAADYALVYNEGNTNEVMVRESSDLIGVDDYGLDGMDRLLMKKLYTDYAGGPVGVRTMAALISEPLETVEDAMEPYLMQIGMLARTPRGRQLTPAGMEYAKRCSA